MSRPNYIDLYGSESGSYRARIFNENNSIWFDFDVVENNTLYTRANINILSILAREGKSIEMSAYIFLDHEKKTAKFSGDEICFSDILRILHVEEYEILNNQTVETYFSNLPGDMRWCISTPYRRWESR